MALCGRHPSSLMQTCLKNKQPFKWVRFVWWIISPFSFSFKLNTVYHLSPRGRKSNVLLPLLWESIGKKRYQKWNLISSITGHIFETNRSVILLLTHLPVQQGSLSHNLTFVETLKYVWAVQRVNTKIPYTANEADFSYRNPYNCNILHSYHTTAYLRSNEGVLNPHFCDHENTRVAEGFWSQLYFRANDSAMYIFPFYYYAYSRLQGRRGVPPCWQQKTNAIPKVDYFDFSSLMWMDWKWR